MCETCSTCHGGEACKGKHSLHSKCYCKPRCLEDYKLRDDEACGVGGDAFGEYATCGAWNKGEQRLTPNVLATPMVCKLLCVSKEKGQEISKQYAWLEGVVLTPKHVADTVLFLVSKDSDFVTGLDLKVDGGFSGDKQIIHV